MSSAPIVSIAGRHERLPKDALLEIRGVRDVDQARELEQKLDQMIRGLAIQVVAPAQPGEMPIHRPMTQFVDQGDGRWLAKVSSWGVVGNTGPWMREVKQVNNDFEDAGRLILFGSYLRSFDARDALGQQLSQEMGGELHVVHPVQAPTLGDRMRQLFGGPKPSESSAPADDPQAPRRPGLR